MKATSRHLPRRTTLLAITLTILIALIAGGGIAYGYVVIVYDPANHQQNLRETIEIIYELDQADTQIRLQERMLKHLQESVAGGLAGSATELSDELTAGFTDGADSIAKLYPIEFEEVSPGWTDEMRPVWVETQRATLDREQILLGHVQREMDSAQGRIRRIVNASNGNAGIIFINDGTGQTAALQANEELAALCSAEIDKLIAVRAIRGKRRAEVRAYRQSEQAYGRRRCAQLVRDWRDGRPTHRPTTRIFQSN